MTDEQKKLGRNDPCWCGSGRLYKHCHRREDLAAEQEAQRTARAARAREQAMEERARWSETHTDEPGYQPPGLGLVPDRAQAPGHAQIPGPEPRPQEDPEAMVARFYAELDAGETEAFDIYEMAGEIRRHALSGSLPGGRGRYAELVDAVRSRAPELYREEAALYAWNLIADALVEERWNDLPGLLAEMVAAPGWDETLDQAAGALMYHGQVGALRPALEHAWRRSVERTSLESGGSWLTGPLLLARFYEYMDTASLPRVDDLVLQPAPYDRYIREWLEEAIAHLSAPKPRTWQPADFELVDAEQWSNNLQALLFDFMADQRRSDDVPLSRSHLFYETLHEALSEQLGTPAPQGKGSRKPKAKARDTGRAAGASIIPRRRLLDRKLASTLGFFQPQPYRVIATLELLPAYLHFLARVGAVHPRQMDAAFDTLQEVALAAKKTLAADRNVAYLADAMGRPWSRASLDALRGDPDLAEARAQPFTPPSAPVPVRKPGALETMTFRVTYLLDRNVWRDIEMRRDQTLHDLHLAVQDAVDFDRDHLYSFFTSNRAWDKATDYAGPEAEGRWPADRVRVGDLRLRMKQRILYLFDYGDEHRFDVQLIAENPDAPQDDYPRIVASHGDSPSQYGWGSEDWDDEGDDWDDDEEDEDDGEGT